MSIGDTINTVRPSGNNPLTQVLISWEQTLRAKQSGPDYQAKSSHIQKNTVQNELAYQEKTYESMTISVR